MIYICNVGSTLAGTDSSASGMSSKVQPRPHQLESYTINEMMYDIVCEHCNCAYGLFVITFRMSFFSLDHTELLVVQKCIIFSKWLHKYRQILTLS